MIGVKLHYWHNLQYFSKPYFRYGLDRLRVDNNPSIYNATVMFIAITTGIVAVKATMTIERRN